MVMGVALVRAATVRERLILIRRATARGAVER